MRVALTHDWLVSFGGAERVLEALHELYPDAPVYTTVYDKNVMPLSMSSIDARTSFIQRLPLSKKLYRYYLPLMPAAFRSFDLKEYDLVISSSHACAKGVKKRKDALHICYCHTPMRYIWDMQDDYLNIEKNPFIKMAAPLLFKRLRRWDVASSQKVDYFIANSRFVQKRIKKYYGRDSEVIYPPVDTARFDVASTDDGYYLVISRLVPQKRTDIIIEAFNTLKKPLKVAGTGRELVSLRKTAGQNIEFHGFSSDEELVKLMAGCKALVFASKEDFGIVPVEAQAAGKPVIVYGEGGASESVIDGRTGLIFKRQSSQDIIEAVEKMEGMSFDGEFIKSHAKQFDRKIFMERTAQYIDRRIKEHSAKGKVNA